MIRPCFSVLIASHGRAHVTRTIETAVVQMQYGDELIVDVNDDSPWGHAARNRMMPRAKGDFLLFIDDDDEYVPGAFVAIRVACRAQPIRMHVFRMVYPDGEVLWRDHTIENNVSTQMIAVPNDRECLGVWGDRYAGDADFIASTLERLAHPPVFHEHLVVNVGHNRLERGR